MRKTYIDYLRVFACINVILLHSAAIHFHVYNPSSKAFLICNIIDSLTRWCVPAFVMITGTLMLNKDITYGELYKKYILKFFMVYIVTNLMYSIAFANGVKDILLTFISGYYHLWYLPLCIVIYAFIPILKEIVKKDKNTEYFLKLTIPLVFVVPFIFNVVKMRYGMDTRYSNLLIASENFIGKFKFGTLLGYFVYLIIGFYISRTDSKRKNAYFGLLLYLVGTLMTIGLTQWAAIHNDNFKEVFYNYLSLNVFLQGIGVAFFIRNADFNRVKITGIIQRISSYTFVVYLVHIFVMNILQNTSLFEKNISNEFLYIMCIAFFTTMVSLLISYFIKKSPLNRYI